METDRDIKTSKVSKELDDVENAANFAQDCTDHNSSLTNVRFASSNTYSKTCLRGSTNITIKAH